MRLKFLSLTYAVLLGSLSPPLAVLVLITCKIARVDYNLTHRPLIRMFTVLVAVGFAIAFIPWITLATPRFVGATLLFGTQGASAR